MLFLKTSVYIDLKLHGPNYVADKNIKANCNIFRNDIVFVPVNVAQLHWITCVIINLSSLLQDFESRPFLIYIDSKHNDNPDVIGKIKKWLVAECEIHKMKSKSFYLNTIPTIKIKGMLKVLSKIFSNNFVYIL